MKLFTKILRCCLLVYLAAASGMQLELIDKPSQLVQFLDLSKELPAEVQALSKSYFLEELSIRGLPLKTIQREAQITATALSPDDTHIALISMNSNLVEIINIETSQTICTITSGAEELYALAYSPDGISLAIAGRYSRREGDQLEQYIALKHFNVLTGACVGMFYLDTGPVAKLVYRSDGQHIALLSKQQILSIWDVGTGTCKWTLGSVADYDEDGDSEAVDFPIELCAYSPDSRSIITVESLMPVADIRNADTGIVERQLEVPESIDALVYSPNGRSIAIGTLSYALIYNAYTGLIEQQIVHDTEWVIALAWSPDSNYVVLGFSGISAVVYNAITGKLENSLVDAAGVNSLFYTGDSKYLFVVTDHALTIWPNLEQWMYTHMTLEQVHLVSLLVSCCLNEDEPICLGTVAARYNLSLNRLHKIMCSFAGTDHEHRYIRDILVKLLNLRQTPVALRQQLSARGLYTA